MSIIDPDITPLSLLALTGALLSYELDKDETFPIDDYEIPYRQLIETVVEPLHNKLVNLHIDEKRVRDPQTNTNLASRLNYMAEKLEFLTYHMGTYAVVNVLSGRPRESDTASIDDVYEEAFAQIQADLKEAARRLIGGTEQ